MGKVIVIEGLDGSGKATQTERLYELLSARGVQVRRVSFPDYDSPSSALVKMYLNGEFGSDPGDVNGYAAAAFYAVDRYASFKKDWGKAYDDGAVILCDRYATSNAVYQMTKVPQCEREEYLRWLEELEYDRLGIPRPDLVIYLDVPTDISQSLMSRRYYGDESKKDLHERNLAYLAQCGESARYSAMKLNWNVISCVRDGKMRSIDDISAEIAKLTDKLILNEEF